tara:strand:+ start:153 stop:308 length:156 start_codon:yes stop_codon:yes gene_type:complete
MPRGCDGWGALDAAAVAGRVGLAERLDVDELLHEVHVLLPRRQLLDVTTYG